MDEIEGIEGRPRWGFVTKKRNKPVARIGKARSCSEEDAGERGRVTKSMGMRELGGGDERAPELADAFEAEERPDRHAAEDLS